MGAAANDPELDGYLAELIAGIGRPYRRLLEVCHERGWLRDDIPFDELVETVAVIASIDTFIRIVERGGWTVDAYRTWFRRRSSRSALPFGRGRSGVSTVVRCARSGAWCDA